MLLGILFLFFLVGCSEENPARDYLLINDRNQNQTYRIQIPEHWEVVFSTANLNDTTQPLCEFYLEEKKIRLTIHNFPTETLEERIPPIMQVSRWQKQLDEPESHLEPVSFGGFVGLQYIGADHKEMMVAWIMQLAEEHFSKIDNPQKKADYSIKAIGPKELVEIHLLEICNVANTFELIEEIPK